MPAWRIRQDATVFRLAIEGIYNLLAQAAGGADLFRPQGLLAVIERGSGVADVATIVVIAFDTRTFVLATLVASEIPE